MPFRSLGRWRYAGWNNFFEQSRSLTELVLIDNHSRSIRETFDYSSGTLRVLFKYYSSTIKVRVLLQYISSDVEKHPPAVGVVAAVSYPLPLVERRDRPGTREECGVVRRPHFPENVSSSWVGYGNNLYHQHVHGVRPIPTNPGWEEITLDGS